MARLVSPVADSMVITSAPRSPRICVAIGPMTTEVRSSTRTPDRAPVVGSSSATQGLDQSGTLALDLAEVTLEHAGGELQRDGVMLAVLLTGVAQGGEHFGQAGPIVHVEGRHELTSCSAVTLRNDSTPHR